MLELISRKRLELDLVRDRLSYLAGVKNTLTSDRTKKSDELKNAEHMVSVFSKVTLLLQGASENARGSLVSRIEKIVTEALKEIIPDQSLNFKVIFESKRGSSEVKFKIYNEKIKQELGVLYAHGGGIKDIISTILRITVLELDRVRSQGPIILDETGKNISVEYQEKFGQFLRALSEKLDRQIIMVTQERDTIALQAHKIFQIEQVDGKASIMS